MKTWILEILGRLKNWALKNWLVISVWTIGLIIMLILNKPFFLGIEIGIIIGMYLIKK